MSGVNVFRASILHCLADPGNDGDTDAVEYFEDGIMVVSDGRISGLGPADSMLSSLSNDIEVTDFSGRLIIPGMID